MAKPHQRSEESVIFWQDTPHPFLSQVDDAKFCTFCGLLKGSSIHIEPNRQPHTKTKKVKT